MNTLYCNLLTHYDKDIMIHGRYYYLEWKFIEISDLMHHISLIFRWFFAIVLYNSYIYSLDTGVPCKIAKKEPPLFEAILNTLRHRLARFFSGYMVPWFTYDNGNRKKEYTHIKEWFTDPHTIFFGNQNITSKIISIYGRKVEIFFYN